MCIDPKRPWLLNLNALCKPTRETVNRQATPERVSQCDQILLKLRKGGKVCAAHSLRGQSVKVRKAWRPENEAVGHEASAIRKP